MFSRLNIYYYGIVRLFRWLFWGRKGMIPMKLLRLFTLLLLICLFDVATAEVHLSVTPYYHVSEEEIIGGLVACSNGNVLMCSKFLRGEGPARLLSVSSEGNLLQERVLEFNQPVFLKEVNGKLMIGFIHGGNTLLRFIDDSHEWVFSEEIPWLNTHKFDDSTYLVKIYGNPPDFYIQKIMENNSPVDTTHSRVMIGDYILPQNLFSDVSSLYYLKNYAKKKGIYKLIMENESPKWELFLKGNFFQSNAIFNDVHKFTICSCRARFLFKTIFRFFHYLMAIYWNGYISTAMR